MKELIDYYYDYLKANTTVRNEVDGGWYVVYLPIELRFRDMMEIYIKKEGDKIIISDDGYACYMLAKKDLATIADLYELKLDDNELIIQTDEKRFPDDFQKMIRAIIAANDLVIHKT